MKLLAIKEIIRGINILIKNWWSNKKSNDMPWSTWWHFVAVKIQAQFGLVTPWLKKWCIGLYANKTISALFGDGSAHDVHEICVHEQSVQWCPIVKYFGVYLEKRLKL